jgi:hypothetical protein
MSTTTRLLLILLLVVAAFLAGYWPKQREAAALRADLDVARASLTEADAKARASAMRDELALAYSEAAENNFGYASQRAGRFFDQARAIAAETDDELLKRTLEDALARRESITAQLSAADPAARAALADLLRRLHGSELAGR